MLVFHNDDARMTVDIIICLDVTGLLFQEVLPFCRVERPPEVFVAVCGTWMRLVGGMSNIGQEWRRCITVNRDGNWRTPNCGMDLWTRCMVYFLYCMMDVHYGAWTESRVTCSFYYFTLGLHSSLVADDCRIVPFFLFLFVLCCVEIPSLCIGTIFLCEPLTSWQYVSP